MNPGTCSNSLCGSVVLQKYNKKIEIFGLMRLRRKVTFALCKRKCLICVFLDRSSFLCIKQSVHAYTQQQNTLKDVSICTTLPGLSSLHFSSAARAMCLLGVLRVPIRSISV